MSKWDEQILVVDRKTIFSNEENVFYGFLTLEDERVKKIAATFDKYEVKRRGDMEEDPSFKQLIGYALIKDKATKEVLVYKRLVGGGESRLHGKASVGIGGHMNDVANKSIEEVIKINAAREVEEEIGINFDEALANLKFVGLINDDREEVGKVHIGLVYVCEVNKANVKVVEDDTLKIEWLSSENARNVENYESWSQFLVPIM